MRFLIIIDPPESLNPKTDTSIVIIQEMLARGHEAWVCQLHDLSLQGSTPMVLATPVSSVSTAHKPALVLTEGTRLFQVDSFQSVLMRKDPPFDQAYLYATLILEHARGRTFLFNDPRGLREANEKLYIFHFPDLIAPTIVTRQLAELRAFMHTQGGQMMVKPLDGFGGQGVFYVRADDPNTNSLLEISTYHETRWVMAQKYLPEGRQGDKRIILLQGRPIGALLRVPQGYDTRSNLHAGGKPQKTELTPRDYEICETIAPRLLEDGLYFVGIDVIGGYLTEVNVTSPTTIQEINRLEHTQLEHPIVDFLERSIEAGV